MYVICIHYMAWHDIVITMFNNTNRKAKKCKIFMESYYRYFFLSDFLCILVLTLPKSIYCLHFT